MSAHLGVDLPPPRMVLTIPPTPPAMQTLACTAVPEIASAQVSSPNQVIKAGSPGVGQRSESPARDYSPLVCCLVLSSVCGEEMRRTTPRIHLGPFAHLRPGFTLSLESKDGSTDAEAIIHAHRGMNQFL